MRCEGCDMGCEKVSRVCTAHVPVALMLAWIISIERGNLCRVIQRLSPRIRPLTGPIPMAISIRPGRPMALAPSAACGRRPLDLLHSGQLGWMGAVLQCGTAGERSASTSARRQTGGEAVTAQTGGEAGPLAQPGGGPTEAAPEPVKKKRLSKTASLPGEEPPAPSISKRRVKATSPPGEELLAAPGASKRRVKAPAKAPRTDGSGGTGPGARSGEAAAASTTPHFDPASLTRDLPSGEGPWGVPRHWVVFSDLHVTAKTLDTCLKVRTGQVGHPIIHASSPLGTCICPVVMGEASARPSTPQ